MDKYFICLANSYKRGGRCIAGVEVTFDAYNHWVVERHSDGSPLWIRPIDKDTEYGEVLEGEARFIPLFSVVKLTGVIPCPHLSHSEDVFYQQMQPIGMIHPSEEAVELLSDTVHPEIFYSTELGISPETYAQGNYSLMLIHPESIAFVEDPTKNRAKYRMTFAYHGVLYDFSITDPSFYELITRQPDAIETLSDIYLTLSIGLEYEGRHHKLIAGVIIPSKISDSKDFHTIIRQDFQRQISSRSFTKSELSVYKRAFLVPSREGLSVCLKTKAGGEQFLLLDVDSTGEPWQIVILKKSLLVTYQDPMGREYQRLRLFPASSSPIAKLLKWLKSRLLWVM